MIEIGSLLDMKMGMKAAVETKFIFPFQKRRKKSGSLMR